MNVVKRDGTVQKFSDGKLNRWSEWSSEECGVSWSDIVIGASRHFYDMMQTSKIHDLLIDECLNKRTFNHSKMAARLMVGSIYKEAYGDFNIPTLKSFYHKAVSNGWWDDLGYNDEQLDILEAAIDHNKDFTYTYSTLKQFYDKYLVDVGRKVESPQIAFMGIAMATMTGGVDEVISTYQKLSDLQLNLPTPTLNGARTPMESSPSCVVISAKDTVDSIGAAINTAYTYTANRSGIGIEFETRAPYEPVKGGRVEHGGKYSIYKHLQTAVGCMTQVTRGGSATVTYTCLDPEVMDLLTMKQQRTSDAYRLDHLDYSMSVNNAFLERVAKNEDWYLISPYYAPELYDVFYSNDRDKFEEVYADVIKHKLDKTTKVKARDIAMRFITARGDTGRNYLFFVDNVNGHTPFKDKIRLSNLCLVGSDRVVSNYGYLTAKELHDIGADLVLFSGTEPVKASPMKLREKNADVYKITLANGMEHTVTDYHGIPVLDDRGGIIRVACKDIKVGDRVAVQTSKGLFGSKNMPEEAFILGMYQSDGTQYKDIVMIDVWEKDFDIIDEIQNSFNRIHYAYGMDTYTTSNQTGKCVGTRKLEPATFHECDTGVSTVRKKRLASKTLKKALNFEKGYVPSWIWEADEDTQWSYVRGLLIADGTAFISSSTGNPIQIAYTETDISFLKELQLLFQNLGLQTSIHLSYKAGESLFPDGKGGTKYYQTKDCYRLVIGNKTDALAIEKKTGFLSRKGIQLEDREYRNNTKKGYKVVSIDYAGKEDVYCPTVYNDENIFVAQGMRTFNCQEIALPTKPYSNVYEMDKEHESGETALCFLSAIVADDYTDDQYEELAYIVCKLIDNSIDSSVYPFKQVGFTARKRRSIGVGITNLAGYLAKNGWGYDTEEGRNAVHRLAERHSYFLHKASVRLARERGACEWVGKTKYSNGWLPIDTYSKEIDKHHSQDLQYDWEGLRKDVLKHGVRFSVLEAFMPCESSSVLSNSTNGLQPVRSLQTFKQSKKGLVFTQVPNIVEHGHNYQLAWEIDSIDLAKIYGIIQKFAGQGISADFYHDFSVNKSISASDMIKLMLFSSKIGIKTWYYLNFKVTSDAKTVESIGGGDEDDCESCKL